MTVPLTKSEHSNINKRSQLNKFFRDAYNIGETCKIELITKLKKHKNYV